MQVRLTMASRGTAALGARVFAATCESELSPKLPQLIGYVTTPTTRGTDASIGATAVCSAHQLQQIFRTQTDPHDGNTTKEPQDSNTVKVAVQNLNSPALHTAMAVPLIRLDQ